MNSFHPFIKYQRKKAGLTQEELATKAGVGIRFIRDLEQGKETLQINKVEQVLSMFGFQLTPAKQNIDPYSIYWNYLNKGVKITMKNKLIKLGVIISEITDPNESKIVSWKFVPNKNIIQYQKKSYDKLIEIIEHKELEEIELQ